MLSFILSMQGMVIVVLVGSGNQVLQNRLTIGSEGKILNLTNYTTLQGRNCRKEGEKKEEKQLIFHMIFNVRMGKERVESLDR